MNKFSRALTLSKMRKRVFKKYNYRYLLGVFLFKFLIYKSIEINAGYREWGKIFILSRPSLRQSLKMESSIHYHFTCHLCIKSHHKFWSKGINRRIINGNFGATTHKNKEPTKTLKILNSVVIVTIPNESNFSISKYKDKSTTRRSHWSYWTSSISFV